jgi:hypothetical protein
VTTHRCRRLSSSNKPSGFDKIDVYEDIKDIVMRALDSG